MTFDPTSRLTFYDFIGYLFVGFSGLVFLQLALGEHYCTLLEKNEICACLILRNVEGTTDFIALFAASYILGHLISFASSVTLEKYSDFKYAKPSKYLLKLIPGYKRLGFIKIFADSWFIPKMTKRYKKNKRAYFRKSWQASWPKILFRLLLVLVLFPFVILDIIIADILGLKRYIAKPIEKGLREIIKVKLKRIFETKILKEKDHANLKIGLRNYFEPIYHRLLEKSPTHFDRTQNYIVLYGFSRNLSFVGVMVAWLLIIKAIFCGEYHNSDIFFTLIALFTSYCFYLSYLKFYRRFAKEVIIGAISVLK